MCRALLLRSLLVVVALLLDASSVSASLAECEDASAYRLTSSVCCPRPGPGWSPMQLYADPSADLGLGLLGVLCVSAHSSGSNDTFEWCIGRDYACGPIGSQYSCAYPDPAPGSQLCCDSYGGAINCLGAGLPVQTFAASRTIPDVCSCGAQTQRDGAGALSFSCSTACTASCPPRFFCPLTNTTASDRTFSVLPCSPGNYCPGGSTFDRVACSAGALCNDSLLVAALACPNGYLCPDPANNATSCGAGSFCSGGVRGACAGGSYCPSDTTPHPLECPTTTFCPAGSSAPRACTPYNVCPRAGMSAPEPCPPGYTCSASTGNSDAQPCPAGTYDEDGGAYPPTCEGTCRDATWLWASGQTACVYSPAAIAMIVLLTLFFAAAVCLCVGTLWTRHQRTPAARAAKAHRQQLELQSRAKQSEAAAARVAESQRHAHADEGQAAQGLSLEMGGRHGRASEPHQSLADPQPQPQPQPQLLRDRALLQLQTMGQLRADIVARMVLEVTSALRALGVVGDSMALVRFSSLLTSSWDSALLQLQQPSGFDFLATLALALALAIEPHQVHLMPPADLRAALVAGALDVFRQCSDQELRRQQQFEYRPPADFDHEPPQQACARQPFTAFEYSNSCVLQRDFMHFCSEWLLSMQPKKANEEHGVPLTAAQLQQLLPREYEQYALTIEQKTGLLQQHTTTDSTAVDIDFTASPSMT